MCDITSPHYPPPSLLDKLRWRGLANANMFARSTLPYEWSLRMTRLPLMLVAALGLAAPAFADGGDATKGEKEFNKCKACHTITAPDGTVIMKGAKVGPDLYGIVDRAAGSVEGFSYSDVMKEAGEKGLIWTEDNLVHYLPDPSKFLEEQSGDATGKSKMTFKMAKGAEDVVAYLKSVVK